MFVFRKIWCALFSCNTCFEFRPFALLTTNCRFFTYPVKIYFKQFDQFTKWIFIFKELVLIITCLGGRFGIKLLFLNKFWLYLLDGIC